MSTRTCGITGCRAVATVWLKNAGPYDGLALCAPCAARVADMAVAAALADPEVREMVGLPPLSPGQPRPRQTGRREKREEAP